MLLSFLLPLPQCCAVRDKPSFAAGCQVIAQIDKAEEELAKGRADNDSKEVDFLRNSLLELLTQLSCLREGEVVLLRAQAPGQHCLPCHHLAGLPAYDCLCTLCGGPLSTPCCSLTVAW